MLSRSRHRYRRKRPAQRCVLLIGPCIRLQGVTASGGKLMLLDHRLAGDRTSVLSGGGGGAQAAAAPTRVRPRLLCRRSAPGWVRTYSTSLIALETVAAGVAG